MKQKTNRNNSKLARNVNMIAQALDTNTNEKQQNLFILFKVRTGMYEE